MQRSKRPCNPSQCGRIDSALRALWAVTSIAVCGCSEFDSSLPFSQERSNDAAVEYGFEYSPDGQMVADVPVPSDPEADIALVVEDAWAEEDVPMAPDAADPVADTSPTLAQDSTGSGDRAVSGESMPALPSCDYPKCYVEVARQCIPAGACVEAYVRGGSVDRLHPYPVWASRNICYDNGVGIFDRNDVLAANDVTRTITVKSATGLCYTLVSTTADGSSADWFTMTDRDGIAVASIIADSAAKTKTIVCAGEAPAVVWANCPWPDSIDGGADASCDVAHPAQCLQ